MTAITFDTLKFVETLKDAGVSEAQAKAIAQAFRDAQGEVDLATKADLRELEHRLDTRLARIESDIGWIKWIITGGVGLYLLRSIIEWVT